MLIKDRIDEQIVVFSYNVYFSYIQKCNVKCTQSEIKETNNTEGMIPFINFKNTEKKSMTLEIKQ